MKYLIAILALFTLFAVSCTHAPEAPPAPAKRSLVFIHGSFFDSSVWDQVAPEFAQSPLYQVTLITLPGREDNENLSLTEFATNVCGKIPSASTLVVHSFGGAVANQMVGVCSDKIQSIVYVTALVPLKEERAFDSSTKIEKKNTAKAIQLRRDRIAPRAQNIFLKAMDPTIDLKKLPALHFYSESYKPGEEKINYDQEKFDAIPKYYIYASQDPIIGIKTQQKFTQRTAMVKTESIESGHLPMLSKSKDLIEAIKEVL